MNNEELNNAVIGKLAAEGLSIDSNWKDIKKCLSRVVAPTKCIATALKLKYGKQF